MRKSRQQIDSVFTTVSAFLSVTFLLHLHLGKIKEVEVKLVTIVWNSREMMLLNLTTLLNKKLKSGLLGSQVHITQNLLMCSLLPEIECIKEEKGISLPEGLAVQTPQTLSSLPTCPHLQTCAGTYLAAHILSDPASGKPLCLKMTCTSFLALSI